MKRIEPLNWLFMFISLPLILLLTLPLIKMTFQPSVEMMIETITDKDVVNAIARS
ncbi:MAG: molybdenum ABC transporter permease, partial [Desulfobacteraceae bacterium]|nr:molybdenum ABC transporter permease [Desulfobacteraceae bacterium]